MRQELVGSLGHRDLLLASGKLDQLLASLARFSERLKVVEAAGDERFLAREARAWGPALVFGRLWERQGLPAMLDHLASKRKFGFNPERVAFALAVQRLCAPGSDLQGANWVRTVEAPGFDDLALHHFYRALPWLADIREDLERELFWQGRDLFSTELDLVFVDTTSIYVYRDQESCLAKRGYSRDRRPDLPQFVLCLAVDRHGWPIAWDILPGNTADSDALQAMIERFRQRFRIRRAIVVADRGMIGQATIDLLQSGHAPFGYILGCRLRRSKEVAEKVLARPGRYQAIEDNLEVKEVWLEDRRYIVCRNPIEAERDRLAREGILAKLQHTLEHQGPKAVIGHRGYARLLKVAKGSVTLDQTALAKEARLDGKFVLRTNTRLSADEVARAYKSLWRVERSFREVKSTLSVRPVYHQRDDSVIGHIVGCFLALRLEVDLQRRLDDQRLTASWPDLMSDLNRVQAVLLEIEGQRYRLRTDVQGHAYKAFRAAGVAIPKQVTRLVP